MPTYNIIMRRLVTQESHIVITVPDGEVPLENLPNLEDPNIVWVMTSMSALSHDCSPIIEHTAESEPVEEAEEVADEVPEVETPPLEEEKP